MSISSPLNAPGSNVGARLLLRLNGSETWLRAVTVFPAVVTLKDLSGDEELLVGWSTNLKDFGMVVVPVSVVAQLGAGKVPDAALHLRRQSRRAAALAFENWR